VRHADDCLVTVLISVVITDTQLADHTAAERTKVGPTHLTSLSTAVKTDAAHNKETESSGPASAALGALRADLSATQKARGVLQNEVASLTATLDVAQSTHDMNTAKIAALSKQKADVERKLRDRDEELRGKARLVEQTQDEMVSLSLQVNMAEQRSEKLEKENKDLIARWMKRMGEEADKVNTGSGWH
jgi:chromosome segregation ATPase